MECELSFTVSFSDFSKLSSHFKEVLQVVNNQRHCHPQAGLSTAPATLQSLQHDAPKLQFSCGRIYVTDVTDYVAALMI